uniref:Fatty acyl-CoA reductase n=1 Tax=Timema monikensis TaxID=170555 RepID=A0A7R9ECZ5_9NEOP|nr:unnamed protein product [Timema monikensis]
MNIETKHITEREFVAKEHAANIKGTPIQEFYRDFNVLVTGATGFMGKVLIEKLLRSCPNVGRIFILIRTKKGQLPEDRKEELLKSVIFDVLRASSPEFHKKLVVVTGDCSTAQAWSK